MGIQARTGHRARGVSPAARSGKLLSPRNTPKSSYQAAPTRTPPGTNTKQPATLGAEGELPLFSWDEVRAHNTKDDTWLVFRNKVYDVNTLQHPGGDVMYTYAGDDMTDVFGAFHPTSAYSMLDEYLIGKIDPSSRKPNRTPKDAAVEADFRAMRAQLKREGAFEASKLYYLFKFVTTVAIWCASASLLKSEGWAAYLGSATLLALFWQQCGWLSHDFMHHQVFENRFYGDLAGMLIGNFFQGFSVAWWKNKHNTHHAATNVMESTVDAHDGDPDIDTMPVLAWSLELARAAARPDASSTARFLVKYQSITYLPILAVARVSWLIQSFFYPLPASMPLAGRLSTRTDPAPIHNFEMEIASLSGYWVAYLWMMSHYTLAGAVGYFLLSQCICGLMLATVFGLGHNGMEMVDWNKKPNFLELQVVTTRNVAHGVFTDWFTGGLSYQVEHHLFPMCPRHNLHRVAELTQELCAKHGINYTCKGFFEGNIDVLSHLADVTNDLMEEFPAL